MVVSASPRLGWDETGLGANKNAEIDSPGEDLTVSVYWAPETMSGACISNLQEGDAGTITLTYVVVPSGGDNI